VIESTDGSHWAVDALQQVGATVNPANPERVEPG
jgi:hypothetical protein